MRVAIQFRSGPLAKRELALEPGKAYRIGRSREAEIHINDVSVSRLQCRLEVAQDRSCTLTDLGSRNGTLVNGQRVTTHRLADGDTVRLGQVVFGFHVTAPPTPGPVASPAVAPPAQPPPPPTAAPEAHRPPPVARVGPTGSAPRVGVRPRRSRRGPVLAAIVASVAVAALAAALLLGRGSGPEAPGHSQRGLVELEEAASVGLPRRRFNSRLPFRVWAEVAEDEPPKELGETPRDYSLDIPPCRMWWVEPLGWPDMAAVARVLDEQSVPGLRLSSIASDSDLARLREAKGLRSLDLSGTQVTDAGLAHLKGLTELQQLSLVHTHVTDAGLARLKDLRALQTLALRWQRVTDAGLAHLGELKALRTLDLDGTQVTDAGLAHLRELKSLRRLGLSGTQVTDAGLAHLKELAALHALGLEGTRVTDAGLAHLKQLTALRALDLEGTRVTNAGVAHLKEMKALRTLNLWGTRVTGAGIADLERSRPDLRVSR